MKKTVKVLFMAFVAMFAFNTVAEAQIGGLLKAAKKAVSKKETVAAPSTTETTPKKADKGVCEVKNWKTGEMMQTEKLYASMKVLTADEIWGWEKNFRDKEGKKEIVEFLLDNEKFENRKRAADHRYKDRKLVQCIFRNNDWDILRNEYGTISCRRMWVAAIYELTDGTTMYDSNEWDSYYQGDGKYSNNYAHVRGSGNYGFIKDWEHKDDADPLKDL